MKSLRTRLFVLLAAATVLVWSSAAAWSFFHTRAEIRRVLDRRLVEAAGMVASLAENTSTGLAGARQQSTVVPLPRYSRQLSCQIWSLDGRLLGRSSGAPNEPLAVHGSGFSERTIGGEEWRVYTIADATRGVRVSVGDNLSVRQGLISDVMIGLLVPAIAGLAALAMLIWAVVGAGLSPLRDIARQLKARGSDQLAPLEAHTLSREIVPLVDAINAQFAKLEELRANERHFIASAAHELQTPLAGLKTHAQIARAATKEDMRSRSLDSIEQSVERTARLVQQLLDLAREENRQVRPPWHWVPVTEMLEIVADEFEHQLRKHGQSLAISTALEGTELLCDEAELLLALRNIVRNAIDHTGTGSEIKIEKLSADGAVGISVRDSGPGIPPADLQRVRQRFVRGINPKVVGSGLGLSIVEMVMANLDGWLDLENETGGGVRATLFFARDRFRSPRSSTPPKRGKRDSGAGS